MQKNSHPITQTHGLKDHRDEKMIAPLFTCFREKQNKETPSEEQVRTIGYLQRRPTSGKIDNPLH